MVRVAVVIGAAVIASSCARSGSEQPPTRPVRSMSNVLSGEELLSTNAPNALIAVQQLRPTWLRSRGSFSASSSSRPEEVVLYLNEARMGTWQDLDKITIGSVKEMRYFSPADATTRWGTGHTRGAILVVSR